MYAPPEDAPAASHVSEQRDEPWVNIPFASEADQDLAATPSSPSQNAQLPFARYAVTKDFTDTAGPLQTLSDSKNATYVQVQGLKCYTTNRKNVQTKRGDLSLNISEKHTNDN